jgi:methylmalonyl-CoA mutase cobalamin-binding subunit
MTEPNPPRTAAVRASDVVGISLTTIGGLSALCAGVVGRFEAAGAFAIAASVCYAGVAVSEALRERR